MLANADMSIQLIFLHIMSKLTFGQMTTSDLFTFKMKRFQLIAFVIAVIPTFAATFLFARREQIDMVDVTKPGAYNFEEEPLMYVCERSEASAKEI